MKVFEIYFSPTGTSRRVAHAVAAALAGPDQAPVDTIDATRVPVAGAKLPPDGVAVVAVPVYGGRVAPLALQRLEGLSGSLTPLHIDRCNEQSGQGPATANHLQNILQRRPGTGSNHPHAGRHRRQRLLGFGAKQPFRSQAGFQFFKSHLGGANAIRHQVTHVHLKRAITLIQADPTADHNLHTVLRAKRQAGSIPAEHDCLDAALGIP